MFLMEDPDNSSSITTPGGCATFTVSNSVIHAGAFGTRWSAIASICAGPCGRLRRASRLPSDSLRSSSAHFRPASLDIRLAFRWPISRARRQMRGDRIKCLGLRTYRTSCINATDSICRRARMESQSVVKLGQWARVENAPKKAQLSKGNAPATKSSGPPTSNTRSFAN